MVSLKIKLDLLIQKTNGIHTVKVTVNLLSERP
jgi:hypothetical protein